MLCQGHFDLTFTSKFIESFEDRRENYDVQGLEEQQVKLIASGKSLRDTINPYHNP